MPFACLYVTKEKNIKAYVKSMHNKYNMYSRREYIQSLLISLKLKTKCHGALIWINICKKKKISSSTYQ